MHIAMKGMLKRKYIIYEPVSTLVQTSPFPSYPDLQLQENDPIMLIHSAFALQLWSPIHSLISIKYIVNSLSESSNH